MQLAKFTTDDAATASMIGTIVLLGTAVVGAAVAGAFVLDVGSSQESVSVGSGSQEAPPQVQWEWTEDVGGDQIRLEHGGGDTVQAERLKLGGDVSSDLRETSAPDGDLFGSDSVAAGDGVTIDEGDLDGETGTIRLVWTSADGSSAVVLSSYDYDLR